MAKLIVDTTDLRGSTLVKIRDLGRNETIIFGYYRDSNGTEGKLILPPNGQISMEILEEIIRVLRVSYPYTKWVVWSDPNLEVDEEEMKEEFKWEEIK